MQTVPVEPPAQPASRKLVRAFLTVVVVVFAVFWIWALFFASKEAVNKIDDRAWAARAETICTGANEERLELADFRRIDDGGPELIRERATIVDRSTDILERMLNEVVAIEPADQKGQGIVPLWEDDYRTYLQDRRNYADDLRETGENLAFYETAVGIPVSERLETFAGDNEMPACAPPRDLSR
ncbi:MAG: hypothetical protein QNJ12_01765 [Ilumatobacter sp.]|uniref:hypothetical protein n=1 Tax=Ilumatobacter sp. TaxID=1967498 RepID=UPI00261ABA38|nr:hypothetical protein [Ilumatobacter sp.]MDJ0767481.1 hypothetical protein [Ilumatobacter sp.]